MNRDKQIEEMAKAKKCNTCIHNAVCQELENFRDSLGWINTKDEFVCSYYDKASEVAEEIFAELEKEIELALDSNYKVKRDAQDMNDTLVIYAEGKIDCLRGLAYFIAELKKKYPEDNYDTDTEN